ncbi:MAG TPA: DUF1801 domain-containing protein [Candidatus Eisenbacteria bacterium]|jgi:hypothetical protein
MAAKKTGAKKPSSKGPKTQLNSASVPAFLAKAAADRLADARAIVAMMEKATGKKAAMWGDAIVGCDTYAVKYADGHESPWPLVAMSPRKGAFVLYIAWRKHADLLKKIGKHKTAGGCIHIRNLADVDVEALQTLIKAAAKSRKATAG